MPWKKGQSGNPLGRLPGEKQFADQLRIVLAEPVDKNDPKSVRKLRRIAEKLAECALNGEPWAISQVADRIDGKATAEIQTEQRHRYVIEAPAQLTREQWIETYSPKPVECPRPNNNVERAGRSSSRRLATGACSVPRCGRFGCSSRRRLRRSWHGRIRGRFIAASGWAGRKAIC